MLYYTSGSHLYPASSGRSLQMLYYTSGNHSAGNHHSGGTTTNTNKNQRKKLCKHQYYYADTVKGMPRARSSHRHKAFNPTVNASEINARYPHRYKYTINMPDQNDASDWLYQHSLHPNGAPQEPENQTRDKQKEEAAEQLLNMLSLKQREVVELVCIQGIRQATAARLLEISPSTCNKRLKRALHRMRTEGEHTIEGLYD